MGNGFYGVDKGAASAYFNKINSKLSDLTKSGNESNSKLQGSLVQKRIPWLMSTTEWLENGQGIIWYCNPSDISWNINLRQSTSKNAFSTVTHIWPNSNRGTHFDEFSLSLTLQTGNLMPYKRGADASDNSTIEASVSPGLVNFYDFLKLVDAPKLTSSRSVGGAGRSNHVIIRYNSNIFPKLTLIGQFDSEGIKFSDTSSDPNQVTSWTATFLVLDSNPRISDNTNKQSNSVMLEHYFSNMGAKRK